MCNPILVIKVDVGIVQAGQIVTIEFRQKMIIQGEEYLLLGCTGFEKGNLVVYNRLYDVCSISVIVISDKTAVGYYDLGSKVKYRVD